MAGLLRISRGAGNSRFLEQGRSLLLCSLVLRTWACSLAILGHDFLILKRILTVIHMFVGRFRQGSVINSLNIEWDMKSDIRIIIIIL